jgi:Zn-dependent peptidase ImmA (M78 family)
MKQGTPGFIKGRLREAREARGIGKQVQLADLINCNSSAISRWEDESATATPEPATLKKLAEVLNVRVSYFLRPQFDQGGHVVFFRSYAAALKRERARKRARLRWLQEISVVLQHYFDFPKVDIPARSASGQWIDLTTNAIEQIAEELRRHWKLGDGPVANVVQLLERVGFVVGIDRVESNKLDGAFNWSPVDNRPYILLAADKNSFLRSQMDAAHEMAHAILHHSVSAAEEERHHDLLEEQAFRLASAFLLPASSFPLEVTVPNLSALLALSERWKVSVKAMIKRLQDLEIISGMEATQLYKIYSAKGWNKGEPYDRPLRDRPALLGDSIKMLVESGKRTKADLLANEFVFSSKDVERLSGLPEGWFDKRTAQILEFPPQSVPIKPRA